MSEGHATARTQSRRRKSGQGIRRIVGHLKGRATQELFREKLWPDSRRPVWAKNDWHVFLFTPDDVIRAIRYVEDNPLREGKRRQHWPFVVPFKPSI